LGSNLSDKIASRECNWWGYRYPELLRRVRGIVLAACMAWVVCECHCLMTCRHNEDRKTRLLGAIVLILEV
jgi:hypothetical protein